MQLGIDATGDLPDVGRIAVLRGGGLGDLVMALPAITSLRDRYPDAELTLLGTGGHAGLLAGRPGPVDDVLPLPVATGVHEPAGATEDPAATARFFDRARLRRFDLAVQLHGGGRWSNPFVHELAARHTVGARTPDAEPLDRWLPYRYYQHETLRGLEIVGLAGAPITQLEPRLAVQPTDRAAAERAVGQLPRPLLAVHPGATDPRRRWPAERFAEVITAVVHDGGGVVVLGSASEVALTEHVSRLARQRLPSALCRSVRPLAGQLDESALVGVLAASDLLLGNDSGPRHLAAAVGTATVAIYWVGNVVNAGPLSRGRHRVHVAWIVECPVCGRPSGSVDGYERCEHDVSFVADVGSGGVLSEVRTLLDAIPDPDPDPP